MKLVINCVTRGRPSILSKPSTIRCGTSWSLKPALVSIDDDDIDTRRQSKFSPAIIASFLSSALVKTRWAKSGTVRCFTRPMCICPLGDYTHIVTPAFDRKILEAASLFPDNIGVVYSHMGNAFFPSIWCVTHGLAQKMGWMCPPYFPYWFVDHWVDDIARLIGRVSFGDFQIGLREKPGTQEFRELAFWCTLYDVLRLSVGRRHAPSSIPRIFWNLNAARKFCEFDAYPLRVIDPSLSTTRCGRGRRR